MLDKYSFKEVANVARTLNQEHAIYQFLVLKTQVIICAYSLDRMSYFYPMIYRGTTNDIELLQTIGRKTFDDTFGGTCTKEDMKGILELYFNSEQCEKELSDERDHFFFLKEEGVTKGYFRMNDIHDCPIEDLKSYSSVELMRLYVLKEFHGTHVATDLIQFAFDLAKKKGYQRMYLSVWEYNFRARGFYEKHGFRNTGIENDFPLGTTPQTDYWFVKEL